MLSWIWWNSLLEFKLHSIDAHIINFALVLPWWLQHECKQRAIKHTSLICSFLAQNATALSQSTYFGSNLSSGCYQITLISFTSIVDLKFLFILLCYARRQQKDVKWASLRGLKKCSSKKIKFQSWEEYKSFHSCRLPWILIVSRAWVSFSPSILLLLRTMWWEAENDFFIMQCFQGKVCTLRRSIYTARDED